MTCYVEKYPHPGPRPVDPGAPPEGGPFTPEWMRHNHAVEADKAWCARMRRHQIARALDALLTALLATPYILEGDYTGAHLCLYLAALGEPWPREVFA